MKLTDRVRLGWGALAATKGRTALVLVAITIGVGAVVVLTALGEGARRYVTREFAALGSNLLVVLPGRSETTGGMPPVVGETPRDLTIGDALALRRSGHVAEVAPVNVGEATVSYGGLSRDEIVLGSTAALLEARELSVSAGSFLPEGNPRRARSVCVIGQAVRDELFGDEAPIGRSVRVAERRFRVIGVLGSQGESLGVDLDDVVIVPVASAQQLFDTESLFRILVKARSRDAVAACKEDVIRLIKERHHGEEDITVITQDAIMSTFDGILRSLTAAVGGIAAVSLLVAGLLVMNVMLVSVSQRTREIGLLKAVGASPASIRSLFLTEALILCTVGAVVGLVAGLAVAGTIDKVVPALPVTAPIWAIVAASAVTLGTGLLFAWLPARRASRLDAARALSGR